MDSSEYLVTLDGKKHYFSQEHTPEQMAALREKQDASITPSVLPSSLGWLEYRYPRLYVERILSLAQRQGTKVVFLYVPRFGGPDAPAPYQMYASRVGLLNPSAGVQDYRLWDDATHVNWNGAKLLTDAVAAQLVSGGYVSPAAPAAPAAGAPAAPAAPVAP